MRREQLGSDHSLNLVFPPNAHECRESRATLPLLKLIVRVSEAPFRQSAELRARCYLQAEVQEARPRYRLRRPQGAPKVILVCRALCLHNFTWPISARASFPSVANMGTLNGGRSTCWYSASLLQAETVNRTCCHLVSIKGPPASACQPRQVQPFEKGCGEAGAGSTATFKNGVSRASERNRNRSDFLQ